MERRDNPTIGLLIYKDKIEYKLNMLLSPVLNRFRFSEYDLEKCYPEKIEGTIPTIDEIEKVLKLISPRPAYRAAIAGRKGAYARRA